MRKYRLSFLLFCLFSCIVSSSLWAADTDATLIEIPDSKLKIRLESDGGYRTSLDNFGTVLSARTTINLRYSSFDPLVDNPETGMPASLKVSITAPAKSGPGGAAAESSQAYIVQFVTQAFPGLQKQVATLGGQVVSPLTDHCMIILLTPSVKAAVEELPSVRWVGPYHIAYKLNVQPVVAAASNSAEASAVPRYNILAMQKSMVSDVADQITAIGGTLHHAGRSRLLSATLNDTQLNQIAAMKEVLYIDSWAPTEDDMDMVRTSQGANFLESIEGYTGQGVRGEVLDDGIRASHDGFQYNPAIFHGGNSADFDHGTSTYGIVFASGVGNSKSRGVLPDAGQPILASRYTSSYLASRYNHTAELVDPAEPYRAVFQTCSFGTSRTTTYTSISEDMDEIIFDLDIIICQSQSNEGTTLSRPEAWAKNIVAVGGVRSYDTPSRSDDCWCSSASIGPASDGRIKPDLSNYYGDLYTTDDANDSDYGDFSGTSGTTPATAGYFGLLFQMWADGVFDGGPGKGRDVFDTRCHAATAKALMIHSADQYTFSGTGHDLTRVHQGWGFPDVQNLYEMAEANGWSLPILIDETEIISSQETDIYSLTCDGTEPLRVTMVYADPPGNPASSIDRINDLTLKVISPTGTVYWGNNGLSAGNWSTSGGSANTVDTVENVFIEFPEVGTWTIEVKADVIVQDGHVETGAMDADYALIATGGSPNAPPVWAPNPIVKSDAKENNEYSGSLDSNDVFDPEGGSLTFTQDSGPSWLTIAPDGALSGTPAQSNIGLNSWDVTATDDELASTTAVVTIRVLSASDFDSDGDVDGNDLNDSLVGWKALYGQTVDEEIIDGSDFLAWQRNYTGSKVSVPDVVNDSEAVAIGKITGLGLVMGTNTDAYHLTIPLGNVISSTPAAGFVLFAGDAVSIVVSLGPAPVNVPSVVGLTESAASSAITAAGLTVGIVTQENSESVAAGDVISSDPTSGTSVPTGSSVDLVVSLGSVFIILEENDNQNDKIDVKDGQDGAQSFEHDSGADDYEITEVELLLSREPDSPSDALHFTIGTSANGGTIADSHVDIASGEVTNTSGGSSFATYTIVFASPVGPLTSGTKYYLNFETGGNGKAYFLGYNGDSDYGNGTYYKSGTNDNKDMFFKITGSIVPASNDDSTTSSLALPVATSLIESDTATSVGEITAAQGGTNLRLLILKSKLRQASKEIRQGKTLRAERHLQELLSELKEMLTGTGDTDSQRKRIEQILESAKTQLAKSAGG